MPVEMRKIIEIDEEKCDGCGQCVLACAEGALEIVDGKAKLVGEILCDGLGACMGECPQGALTIHERRAEAFDEEAVKEHLARTGKPDAPKAPLECGCPGTVATTLVPSPAPGALRAGSALGHWPVKLRLVQPMAPFLKGADLLLLADCAAAADPNLHADLLKGRAVVMGCPKFDELDAYIEKLAQIIRTASPRSLTVAVMEVPCCNGFVHAAKKAVEASGTGLPVTIVQIARTGEILKKEPLAA